MAVTALLRGGRVVDWLEAIGNYGFRMLVSLVTKLIGRILTVLLLAGLLSLLHIQVRTRAEGDLAIFAFSVFLLVSIIAFGVIRQRIREKAGQGRSP